VASVLLISVAVSLDTIVAGVAFGLRGDPIVLSAMVVGTVTGVLTFAGLAFGTRLSKWRHMHGRAAPVVIVGLGVAIAAGVI
jgi:putative Mn2+ efflux pump MntP